MSTRHAIAVDFGRKQLRAVRVSAGSGRGGLKVRRVLLEDVAADVNVDDAQALGLWVGDRLKSAGFPKGKAVILLGREHVVMKRLTLPTTDAAELPEMVRLAMSREVPFDIAQAVVDFMTLESIEPNTTVLAVAASQTVIDFHIAVAMAAGLTVGRIALRTLGAATLVQAAPDASWALNLLEHNDNRSACTLVIDVRSDSLELAVVRENTVDFSRVAEVPEPQDKLAIAEAIVTETRRTWMSYQTSHGRPETSSQGAEAQHLQSQDSNSHSTPLREALLLGERRVCEYATSPMEQLLGVPARVLDAHLSVDRSGNEIDRVWPLVGVLLEETKSRSTINFANPHRAPDLGARARQRRLIAAGVALVACLAAWTMARHQLKSLSARADSLTVSQREQSPAVARYWRDRYKLEHIKRWESASVDWLQHASYLSTIAPPPDRLVLDAWTGSLKFEGVTYDKTKGKWLADTRVTISIDGEAKDRDTADSFRASLVRNSIYETTTPGADARAGRRMPIAFTYTLRAKNGSAPPPAATPAGSSDAQVVKADGGKP